MVCESWVPYSVHGSSLKLCTGLLGCAAGTRGSVYMGGWLGRRGVEDWKLDRIMAYVCDRPLSDCSVAFLTSFNVMQHPLCTLYQHHNIGVVAPRASRRVCNRMKCQVDRGRAGDISLLCLRGSIVKLLRTLRGVSSHP